MLLERLAEVVQILTKIVVGGGRLQLRPESVEKLLSMDPVTVDVDGKVLQESFRLATRPALVNDHPIAGPDLEAAQQVDPNP
jgi:hypothetical protein